MTTNKHDLPSICHFYLDLINLFLNSTDLTLHDLNHEFPTSNDDTHSSLFNHDDLVQINSLRNDTKSKIRESLRVIASQLNVYHLNQLSISYNGGKDCLVLLILYLSQLATTTTTDNNNNSNKNFSKKPLLDSIYINYEHNFSDLDSFIDASTLSYHLHLTNYSCDLIQGFRNYLSKFPSKKAILIGVRKNDPYSQHLNFVQNTDNNWPSFIRINPILNWNLKNIWFFILFLKINYCSLYNLGYTSLGGTNSTIKNPNLLKIKFALLNHSNNSSIQKYFTHLYNKNNKNNLDFIPINDPLQDHYPAFFLQNDLLERAGRFKPFHSTQ
ncbi:FAD synthase [Ascoidea rubescens DSM 1968]|uniref:FAD synthase n=1 Tax=Ascoidea rubescens DSM 1968 TaxID=1344418 RepID=A0A1D2VHF5_9ASCO|nr:adenine nucleotide alpha hydrolases-like protein [Ascoidea rubescens DSM 1968]ODV61066.1 adenine nucleotide alpha hydrolases-like protein [Ascoidea rubescens DSM 1968]